MMPQDRTAPPRTEQWQVEKDPHSGWKVRVNGYVIVDCATEEQARLIAAAPAKDRLCEDLADALEPFAAVAEFIAERNLPADWLWQPTTSHGSQPPGITREHVDAALVAFKAAGRATG